MLRKLSAGLVIPTYYRPHLLHRALQHWQKGAREPDQVIIVDASPDAEKYRTQTLKAFPTLFSKNGSSYLIAKEPSATAQRNQGIDALWTDVTLLPDDDQVPTTDYLRKLMEVFESDTRMQIGGIRGWVPEPGKRTIGQRLHRLGLHVNRWIEGSFLPKSDLLPKEIQLPPEVQHLPVRRIPILWQTGTNFRTHIIRSERFDENLKRIASNEDAEVSLRIGKRYCLAERKDAHIHHLPTSDGRMNGLQVFLLCWINSAYLVQKNFRSDKNARRFRRTLMRADYLSRLHRRFPKLPSQKIFNRYSYPVAKAMVSCILSAPAPRLVDVHGAIQGYVLDDSNYLMDLKAFVDWRNRFDFCSVNNC